MPLYSAPFRLAGLFTAIALFAASCTKETLSHPFVGHWTTQDLANHGFVINAGEDHQLSGDVYITIAPGQVIPISFFGGRWDLSEDGKILTLDFGSAENYGQRHYEILSTLDPYVVRLKIQQKGNLAAPTLELVR